MIKDFDRFMTSDIVKRIIDEYDLMGLFELNAPNDEYDLESKEIADAIGREGPVSVEELSHIIHLVFRYHFYPWSIPLNTPKVSAYKPTAKKVWNSLPKSYRRV